MPILHLPLRLLTDPEQGQDDADEEEGGEGHDCDQFEVDTLVLILVTTTCSKVRQFALFGLVVSSIGRLVKEILGREQEMVMSRT